MPDALLEPHSYYYYYLSGFADIAGNNGSLGATYFQHRAGSKTRSRPTLVSIAPANGGDRRPGQRAHSGADVRAHRCRRQRSAAIQLTPAVAGTIARDRQTGSRFSSRLRANLAVSTGYTVQIGPGCGIRPATRWRRLSTRSRPAPRRWPTPTAPTRRQSSARPAVPPNVSVSSPIVLTASEPIRSFAFINTMRVFANIPLFGSVQLAGTYTLNASGTVVTFTPQVPYPGGTAIPSTRTTMERRRTWPATRYSSL